MDAVLFITLIFAILYLTIALILLAFPQPKAQKIKPRMRVAVLIAMRNEQEYIGDCLTSLSRQDYDPEFFDVFILDDRSADRSPEIAREFTGRFSNFHLISVKNELPGLKGKMNVLAQGLKQIDHELVLITDADCVAPKTWISRMVSYFSPEVGMAGALTVLYPFDESAVSNPQKNLFAKVQALDWIFLQTLASANSNAGKPITILGNNFAFRKETYEQVGGFEAVGFSVTEDFALMEAVRKKTSWKIIHTLDPENSIYSHPSPDLRSFFRQRYRWIKGGKSVRPWGLFILSFSVITHLLILVSSLLSIANLFTVLSLFILLTTDFAILTAPLKKLRLVALLKHFIWFELFYFAYLLVFGVFFFLPLKVRWKGRNLS